jgi:hypothetical protein
MVSDSGCGLEVPIAAYTRRIPLIVNRRCLMLMDAEA